MSSQLLIAGSSAFAIGVLFKKPLKTQETLVSYAKVFKALHFFFYQFQCTWFYFEVFDPDELECYATW